MADSRNQAYAQQLDALTRQAEELSAEGRRRVLELLRHVHAQVLADIAQTPGGSYSAARLQMLKAQVDRNLENFGAKASADVAVLEAKTYRQIAVQIDTTVAAGTGGVLVQPVIDRAALQVVQGYTADLISGLSRDASAKINAAIQRGYLGGTDLQQTVEAIGRALDDGKFSGLFSQIGERAMTIATNEIGRVNSLASISRIQALKEHHPGLGKRWLHIPVARVPRISHLIADGQVRKPDEPFLVEGEELMYPRDPSGSAENTINCHCLVQPYLSEDQLKPTDQERQLLKSYGLSIETRAA